jgi:hypothetical protein
MEGRIVDRGIVHAARQFKYQGTIIITQHKESAFSVECLDNFIKDKV